jgi:hypothetical protein
MINIKDIVKNNNIAKMDYAIAGNLYYKVETDDYQYIFSINMKDENDVGTATFNSEEKAITLMRWIRKAICNGTLVAIKK